MKKVLWFGGVLSSVDRCSTGTWLDSMSRQLAESKQVILGNIAFSNVLRPIRQDLGNTKQWIIPASRISTSSGLPSKKTIEIISSVVDEFSPNVIHVWGVESFAGLLTSRNYLKQPALLEMQGVKGELAKVYEGGLSAKEQRKCIGIKEILKWRSIKIEKARFEKWGGFEKEIIKGHKYISTQTDWVDSYVKAFNPDCKTFLSFRSLNFADGFNETCRWNSNKPPVVLFAAAYSSPFKGMHVAIRAIAMLRRKFPDIQLRIAGQHSRKGIRRDGYISWIVKQIELLGIKENVIWLGPLSSDQMCIELKNSSVYLLPSFLENCSTTMQEAMAVGVPVVASYTGGLPSLARDEESALFFPPGDEISCARQVARLLTDKLLAESISKNGLRVSNDRNNPLNTLDRQLKIYNEICSG